MYGNEEEINAKFKEETGGKYAYSGQIFTIGEAEFAFADTNLTTVKIPSRNSLPEIFHVLPSSSISDI